MIDAPDLIEIQAEDEALRHEVRAFLKESAKAVLFAAHLQSRGVFLHRHERA
ncbi:hypothetical protein GCM10027278_03710 [Paralcaligenes ginsengisoli]